MKTVIKITYPKIKKLFFSLSVIYAFTLFPLQAKPFKHDGLFLQSSIGVGKSEVIDPIYEDPRHEGDPLYPSEEYRVASCYDYVSQFRIGYTFVEKGFMPYVNGMVPFVGAFRIGTTGLENVSKDKKHNYYYQGLSFGLSYYITPLDIYILTQVDIIKNGRWTPRPTGDYRRGGTSRETPNEGGRIYLGDRARLNTNTTYAIGKEFWYSSETAFGISLFYVSHIFNMEDPYTDIHVIRSSFYNKIYGVAFTLTYN